MSLNLEGFFFLDAERTRNHTKPEPAEATADRPAK